MNVLKQLFNILPQPVYLHIAGYLLITASTLTGCRPVVVLSGSMEPAFPVGSVIYYKAAPFEQIQEGNPITFHVSEAGSLIAHRVVEEQELNRDFTTRGDANETADPNPISYDHVTGRAPDVKIPYAEHLVTYGRTPQVVRVMGEILMIGILLDFIYPGRRREEKA